MHICSVSSWDSAGLARTFAMAMILFVGARLASAQDDSQLIEKFNAAKKSGNQKEAIQALEQLLPLIEKIGEDDQTAFILALLASEHYESRQYANAEPLYLRALTLRRKALGENHEDTASTCRDLGWLYTGWNRHADAERYFRDALAIRERLLGGDHEKVAISFSDLAWVIEQQGRYAEAVPLYTRELEIREKVLGKEHPEVAESLNNLANLYNKQGRYSEAEPLYKRALDVREKVLGKEHPEVANSLNNLAELWRTQGRYAEAEPLYKRTLDIREKVLGNEHPSVASSLNNLANLYTNQGRFADTEPLYKRALDIREKVLGQEHPSVADSLNNLANLYANQGRYADAEPLYKRTLDIREKVLGNEHLSVASSLNNLANLYTNQGRYADAEPLYKRALDIREKVLGQENPSVADSLNNLAILYVDQGRYADAEPLYTRALDIREKVLGNEHPSVASSLNNLAILYKNQGRYADAEPLYKRALDIREKVLEKEHPEVADSLNNLAEMYAYQGRYADAEPFYKRSIDIYEKVLGKEHPRVATSLNNLAILYKNQGRYADAEPLYKRAIDIREKVLGKEHPDVGRYDLYNLSLFYDSIGRSAEAAQYLDRAIAILKKGSIAPGDMYKAWQFRAQLQWEKGKWAEAFADLKMALDLADVQRTIASGDERQRADYFASFARGFEQMVGWQALIGDVGEALTAVERSRARSLQDQMNASGVDLLKGVPADLAATLQQREGRALAAIAGLEKILRDIDARKDLSILQKEQEREKLSAQLKAAREEYVKAYADIRANSPAYRLAVGQDQKPIALAELQRWVARQKGLLLEYLVGLEGGYLLVVPGEGKPRIEALALTEEQAAILGASAGPLTEKRLHSVLANDDKTGVLQLLSDEKKSSLARKKLATLWEVLIPPAERTALRDGNLDRLLVIPDGELAAFPFEALNAAAIGEPEYLLDFGPPIQYAPSATILFNLAQRQASARPAREPVLSIAVADYSVNADSGNDTMLAMLTTRSRAGRAGVKLNNLPGAETESVWVTSNFRDQGIGAGVLFNSGASEDQVRRELPGRRLLHFACHGMVDSSPGNLFGALALAQNTGDDPANDGFLTLAEIYALNLSGCELTLLSACETNLGPQQRGEGSLALSRGFLVAGSRRVIASNWLVSDEAAPSMVSYLCAILAKAEKEDRKPDYAAALRDAKHWLRSQDKWSQPYHWAPMTLIGPQ